MSGFYLKVFALLILLMVFVPGLAAFFSLRHTLCSFIALLVTTAVTILVLHGSGAVLDGNALSAMLTILCSMAICYPVCWLVMHFVLPKTLLSNVSKKARWITGITLLAAGFLVVLYCLSP